MANLARASEKASWRFLCFHCLDTLSQPPAHPVTVRRLHGDAVIRKQLYQTALGRHVKGRTNTWKHLWMILLASFEVLRSMCKVLRSHDINSTGSDCWPILKRFLLAFMTACKNSCGLTC